MSKTEAYYWAGALVSSVLLSGPLFQMINYFMIHLGMKFRVACCSLIYRKVLRASITPKVQTTSGQVKIFNFYKYIY